MEIVDEHDSECNDRLSRRDPSRILHIRHGKFPSHSGSHTSSVGVCQSSTQPEVVVLCEFWPVWLFCLIALPCSFSRMWVQHSTLSWLTSLQACYPQVSFECGINVSFRGEQLVFFH
jgi:hypothetical protein